MRSRGRKRVVFITMMVALVHEDEKDGAKHDVASLSHVTQLHDACAHDVNSQQSTLRMQDLNEEYQQQLATCVQKRSASLHIFAAAAARDVPSLTRYCNVSRTHALQHDRNASRYLLAPRCLHVHAWRREYM